MQCYRAFGLQIASSLPLGPDAEPEALAAADAADVRLVVESEGGSEGPWHLDWEGVCKLRATAAEIRVACYPGASERDVALAVSGAGLALVLERRGLTVLHGSCVAINGAAVCLLGDSGAGKSTLATALQRAGHRLLSDGMTAVSVRAGRTEVFQGWPKAKLLPDAARALGWDVQALPLVQPDSTKVLVDVPRAGAVTAPLVSALVVTAQDPPAVQRLSHSQAAFELVKNSLLIELCPPVKQAAILERSVRLVELLSVMRLDRGTTLAALPTVLRLVEEAVADATVKGAAAVASST